MCGRGTGVKRVELQLFRKGIQSDKGEIAKYTLK